MSIRTVAEPIRYIVFWVWFQVVRSLARESGRLTFWWIRKRSVGFGSNRIMAVDGNGREFGGIRQEGLTPIVEMRV